MSKQERADLGRWEITATRQGDEGEYHPDRNWEILLHFPDLEPDALVSRPPEYWGSYTEADHDAYRQRAKCIAALVHSRLCDGEIPPRECGANIDNGSAHVDAWFMAESKAQGVARMKEVVTEVEAALDALTESRTLLSDVARAQRAQREKRDDVVKRFYRLVNGLDEAFKAWVWGQIAHMEPEAQNSWLDDFEPMLHQKILEAMAQERARQRLSAEAAQGPPEASLDPPT